MQVESAFTSSNSIVRVESNALREGKEVELLLYRRRYISSSAFDFNFNGLTDGDVLLHFRFRQQDIIRMIYAVAWPPNKRAPTRNRFSFTPLLATCVILCRLASPGRWKDLEILCGKHGLQIAERHWSICW